MSPLHYKVFGFDIKALKNSLLGVPPQNKKSLSPFCLANRPILFSSIIKAFPLRDAFFISLCLIVFIFLILTKRNVNKKIGRGSMVEKQ